MNGIGEMEKIRTTMEKMELSKRVRNKITKNKRRSRRKVDNSERTRKKEFDKTRRKGRLKKTRIKKDEKIESKK